MATKTGLLVTLGISTIVLLSSCSLGIGSVSAPDSIKALEANIVESNPSVTHDDIAKNNDYEFLPSTGEQRVLVLPISFIDIPCQSSSANTCPTYLANIETAFRGATNPETNFISVRSFYYESSYHALDLNFRVATTFYNAPNSFAAYRKQVGLNPDVATSISDEVIDHAYNQYVSETGDTENYNSVIAIYLADYRSLNVNEQELFWAYTVNLSSSTKSYDNYMWASYYFMSETNKYGLDTHTYIHETAHLMGIDDYYNYDNSLYNAASVLDTMVGNVGDHNAYTKFLLGWIKPIYPTSEGKITLKPFVESGEALIIGNNFNGSAYDEYLICIYYTPTGLNERDISYPDYPLYNSPGILIYHVDSRLATIYPNGNYEPVESLSDLDLANNNYQIFHSNTPSKTIANDKGDYLLTLIESSGSTSGITGYLPTARGTLFTAGMAFGVGRYTDYTFHNGKKPEYKLYVDSLTQDNETIATLYVAK